MNPSARKTVVGVGVVAAVIAAYWVAKQNVRQPAGPATVAERRVAPDFALPGLNGEIMRLSDYRGKVVLLDFWATWCTPCREEIPQFIQLQDKYKDQGFQIVGVSMDDSPEPVRDFYQQYKMNYPVVMGTAKVGSDYGGVLGLPIAFVIGPDGRIYAKHIGATTAAVIEKEIGPLLTKPEAGRGL